MIGIDESVSRKSRRNDTRRKIGHSHQTRHEFCSDERDLREHLERRAQQAILGIRLRMTWRSRIERERVQNMQKKSHNESFNPRDYNCNKQINWQIVLNEN